MREFLSRISSREFLLTACGAVYLFGTGQTLQALVLVLGYLGIKNANEIASYLLKK